ncbi:MAG: diacylglycerol kinase family protein [Polaribacter sp.]|jgi:diacylglycerol kinase (ATP)|nr:diacylglycerol kinase family protein [Polaribacter sp.]MDG1954239.1 diacylglycerol kinase family protein [Polaribacter sp.]MDG2073411.1 diacylglycerol kinase family protein [Polaribacter sp.]
MKNSNDSFLRGRIRSVKFALKGMWLLLTTEDSIKAQFSLGLISVVFGFYFDISATEWMLQLIVIALVLVAEACNTAVEKMADFVHPEFHKKIGFIKDIAAGAPSFAAIFALIVTGIIYVPKILELF